VRSVFERLRPVDQGDGRTPVWTWLLHALPRPDGLLPGAEIIAGIIWFDPAGARRTANRSLSCGLLAGRLCRDDACA